LDLDLLALIDDPAAQSLGDGFRLGVSVQLVVYVANVIAGCMNAYLEQIGRSLICVAPLPAKFPCGAIARSAVDQHRQSFPCYPVVLHDGDSNRIS
jgi:hypothetical protein